MRWCAGCKAHQRLVEPRTLSCKRGKLCEEIDVCVAEYICRRRGVTCVPIDEMRQLQELIYRGFVSASARALTQGYPATSDEFVAMLHELHALLFRPTSLPFGGRFRIPGEPVFFGRDEKPGAEPETIEGYVRALYDHVWQPHPNGMRRDMFVQSCAVFLHRFFLIHPYQDGNGRIARFVLQVAARATGQFSMRPLETYGRSGRQQRRYLQALRYADRHTHGIEARRSMLGKDPYQFLHAWLDRLIEVASRPSAEALPPEEEDENDAW